jgi:hypothetical protein
MAVVRDYAPIAHSWEYKVTNNVPQRDAVDQLRGRSGPFAVSNSFDAVLNSLGNMVGTQRIQGSSEFARRHQLFFEAAIQT